MTNRSTPEAPLDALFAALEHSERALLMLDYDGTLAPFRSDPALARPYPGIAETIDAIIEMGSTRVVVITGRRAAEIPGLLSTRHALEVWGCHGWERLLPDGALTIEPVPKQADDALRAAGSSADHAQRLGARLERKPSSLALHWRDLPEERVASIRSTVEEQWSALCRNAPVVLMPFDGGLELRASGRSKAHAVRSVVSESPASTPAAFLGDDVTDEDAFVALQGRALCVLVRSERRPSAASVWLRPPEELAAFLQRWLRAREMESSSSDRIS
jgi:trehalose-phosphatase